MFKELSSREREAICARVIGIINNIEQVNILFKWCKRRHYIQSSSQLESDEFRGWKGDLFLRHTWLYLYSTRTMGVTVLSQEEKNLGEGSKHSVNEIMTSDDSQKTHRWLQWGSWAFHGAVWPKPLCYKPECTLWPRFWTRSYHIW